MATVFPDDGSSLSGNMLSLLLFEPCIIYQVLGQPFSLQEYYARFVSVLLYGLF
jgi:hypothetical protein